MDRWLTDEVGPNGEWLCGGSHFGIVNVEPMIAFAVAAQRAGFRDCTDDPRLTKVLLYHAKSRTPRAPRRGNARASGAWGRGPSGDRLPLFAIAAWMTAKSEILEDLSCAQRASSPGVPVQTAQLSSNRGGLNNDAVKPTVVINVVGLTPGLVGPDMPRVAEFCRRGRVATIAPVIPAVTCSVQATYLTGRWPSAHGIVGNGWYFRDECEVRFWRQSNKLVVGDKIWDEARQIDPRFTCANLFWWYNMYSTVDVSVTPRPMYPSDGRKLPDIYTSPSSLRDELQRGLGIFPLFQFWGPTAGIASSQWIAAAAKHVTERFSPTLTLIYLPHLDYGLQRHGPDLTRVASDLRAIDVVVGELIDFYEARGTAIVLLSEYGITRVSRTVHLNRVLRQAGLLRVRVELGRELLDAGDSAAFAVADHQVAHVYVNDRTQLNAVRELVAGTPGVAQVYDESLAAEIHLNHPRAGELIALSEPDAWFTYYYWLDDARQPDFAPTVDIHRKPGYDPAELFLDPQRAFPHLKIAMMLLKKKLGFRCLMDVIPTDGRLVRGSHGLPAASREDAPVFISTRPELLTESVIAPTSVRSLLLKHLCD